MQRMRLGRLWQPRTGLFWQMMAFNLLSSLFAWALRSLELTSLGTLLLGALALANVGFGLLAAWRLLQRDPAVPGQAAIAGGSVVDGPAGRS